MTHEERLERAVREVAAKIAMRERMMPMDMLRFWAFYSRPGRHPPGGIKHVIQEEYVRLWKAERQPRG